MRPFQQYFQRISYRTAPNRNICDRTKPNPKSSHLISHSFPPLPLPPPTSSPTRARDSPSHPLLPQPRPMVGDGWGVGSGRWVAAPSRTAPPGTSPNKTAGNSNRTEPKRNTHENPTIPRYGSKLPWHSKAPKDPETLKPKLQPPTLSARLGPPCWRCVRRARLLVDLTR